MIGITDEEKQELYDNNWPTLPELYEGIGIGAKAQLKKVVKWGSDRCPHTNLYSPNLPEQFQYKKRKDCYECWQSLLEEVK